MINWLNEHFKQPLGLLGLLAIILIIIIYLIKARYVERPVSSTFIWQRSLKYIKRKIPMSVIMSLLLIIQILTVITASLAISRPLIKPLKSNETILILDASVSMQTEDTEGKTRFDLGIEKVLEFAKEAGTNSKVSLILADNKPSTIFERLDSEVDITYAVEELECTDFALSAESMDVALTYANNIKKSNVGATIKFITDKDYALVENLEIINVARETDKNVSILSVKGLTLANKNFEFTADLTSYGFDGFGSECTISLNVTELVTENGQTREVIRKYVKIVQVPNYGDSGEAVEVVFTPTKKTSDDPTRVYVNIDPIKDYKDAEFLVEARDGLKIDNVAYLYKNDTAKPKILMVSKFFSTDKDGNVDPNRTTSLVAALSANNYSIRSENMYKEVPEDMDFSGFDLYIFEGVELPKGDKFPTDGAVWVLNPETLPNDIGWVLGDQIVDETVEQMGFDMYLTSSGSDSTSHAYTTISNEIQADVKLGSYTQMSQGTPAPGIEIKGSLEKIFSCGENDPALLAGNYTTSDGTIRMVVTSFDFRNSNWAYLVTDYVLLTNNLVSYSVPTALPEKEFNIGDVVDFNTPAGASKVSLYYDGTLIDTQTNISTMKAELSEVGVYEFVVEYANGEKEAKSYKLPTRVSGEECNISAVGDAVIAPAIIGGTEVELEPIEIFPYLIAFLLLLLIVEWGVYHRDGF